MGLKRLDSPSATPVAPEKVERFQSLARPYPPGHGEMAFGGYVYAQSAYAASKTVNKGFVIHDMTGLFILQGQLDVPFVYTVRHIRDGAGRRLPSQFPGLDVRKVDMMSYNAAEEVKKYRQLTLYALKGSPQDSGVSLSKQELEARDNTGEFDNLYACAHMYASDKNSLLLIPRALGDKTWSAMASLTLTVVFHHHGEALEMIDWDVGEEKNGNGLPRKWFVQEGWTPTSGENRAVHESYLWSPEGVMLASSYQDSMLRLKKLARVEKL